VIVLEALVFVIGVMVVSVQVYLLLNPGEARRVGTLLYKLVHLFRRGNK
jgi:hypothetical protein